MKISPVATKIVETLEKAGYEAWIVGGAVRDSLLSRPTKDWDVTTSATPEQVMPLFEESFYDNAYGTVMVAGKHLKVQFGLSEESATDEEIFDITTYRTEHGYSDKRRPDTVEWGKTVEEDLARRDFTINAIAIRPGKNKEEIIDPYGGQSDLKLGVIRAVGEPVARFEEDALRILRAVRLGAELGFIIEPKTLEAIKVTSTNLKHISAERIGAEVVRVLASPNPADGILLMGSTGILPRADSPEATLSARERSCLALSARGFTSRDIATRLGIATRTVDFHIGNVLVKLAAANRHEAIAKAAARGLLAH